ncbi:MAG: zf-HC2 domain-containing protein [Planctomycetota bacterium]|jgi:hypothetical protein|nr:zf-HC2 domain-containing protein [Planctomycetota bacterium]
MSCSHFQADLIEVLRGESSPERQEEVRSHLDSCPECRQESEEIQRVFEAVSLLPSIEPSPEFAASLASRLDDTPSPKNSLGTRWSEQVLFTADYLRHRVRTTPLLAASILLHAGALGLIATFLFQNSIQTQGKPHSVELEILSEKLPDSSNLPTESTGSLTEESFEDLPERVDSTPKGSQDPHQPIERKIVQMPQSNVKKLLATVLSSPPKNIRRQLAPWLRQRLPEERLQIHAAPRAVAISTAVNRGLLWLSQTQRPDGSWSAGETFGASGYEIGVTGLATLSFLSAGHPLHDEDPYRQTLKRAIHALERARTPDGLIGPPRGHYLYNHSIALIALIEARLILLGSKRLESLQPAVDVLSRAQTSEGGWGYTISPETTPDTSVTGWALSALWIAHRSGLKVPARCFLLAQRWLEQVTDPSTAQVGYRFRGEISGNGSGTTAVGLYIAGLLELPRNPLLQQQARWLTSPEQVQSLDRQLDYYCWYHTASALHHHKGRTSGQWLDAVNDKLIHLQLPSDHRNAGSWPPASRWGRYAGRVYTTSLALLTLQTPHRYR